MNMERNMSVQKNGDHQDLSENTRDSSRLLTEQQWRKFENYAEEIFGALGMDMNNPATQETPRRFMANSD
jgi:GTP cyclohydrolase I